MSQKSDQPAEILKQFLQSNQQFVKEVNSGNPLTISIEGFSKYKTYQEPKVAILACADSRVSPELISMGGFGDVFVVRSAGNIADSHAIGSLEFAVSQLKTPLVVVLGHSGCGAVKAASGVAQSGDHKSRKPNGHLERLAFRIAEGFPSGESDLATLTQINAQNSAMALIKESPVLRQAVEKNSVQIVTGIYSLETGRIELINQPMDHGGSHE